MMGMIAFLHQTAIKLCRRLSQMSCFCQMISFLHLHYIYVFCSRLPPTYDPPSLILTVWVFITRIIQGNEMKIQTIFEAFEQFQLGVDAPTKLYSWIVSGLQKVFLCFLKWKSNFMIWTRSINAHKSAKVPNREIIKDRAHLCMNILPHCRLTTRTSQANAKTFQTLIKYS